MSGEAFRVDLRGIVDILSHHLYSSPRVYLRELLQNARDAVTARRALGHWAPADIVVEVGDGSVSVSDFGIGLTAEEMRSVLATIGASSKRQDFLAARRHYIGQFGIGLLSCFLVADSIEVRSRSAREPDAPTLTWVGLADGTFTIEPSTRPLSTPGTTVTVRARADEREWVSRERVAHLAERFAQHLDLPVLLGGTHLVSGRPAPWASDVVGAAEWCRQHMNFTPLAVLPLDVPSAGIRGTAFIADSLGRVGSRRGDTVYSRGMFVADDNTQLAPDWAYFARLAVDAGELPLTAARESLQESELVGQVETVIGEQIREGIERLAATDPGTFARFLDVHAKGLLAMAATDKVMLDLVVEHVQWETNAGNMTLARAMRSDDTPLYTTSRADFVTYGGVLRAQRRLLINGSYVYGREILRLAAGWRGRSRRIDAFDQSRFMESLPESDAHDPLTMEVRRAAGPVAERLGLHLELRSFSPDSMPVIYVREDESVGLDHDDAPDPWAEFLDEPPRAPQGPRLILNTSARAVRSLAAVRDPYVREQVVAGLYVIGLLTAGEKLGDHQRELLDGSLHTLIDAVARA